MEAQTQTGARSRWRPSRRVLVSGLLSLALLGAVVPMVSANEGGGHAGGDVTITAIDGNQLTLTSADGWTRTVDASNASVSNATTTITLADLKVGDAVMLAESRNFDGSETVTSITVVAPTLDGIVTAVDSTTLAVKQADGTTRTATLDGSTTYMVNGAAAAQSAITVGSDVTVQGTAATDGSFTATSVAAHPASVSGTVTATTADTITLSDASGATLTVKVSASTTYRTGSGAGTISDVTTGSMVRAQGVYNADGSLTATSVAVGTDTAPLVNGHGNGFGPKGHGNGGPGDGGPRDGGHGNGFGHQPGSRAGGTPITPTPSTPASPTPSVSPSASPSA